MMVAVPRPSCLNYRLSPYWVDHLVVRPAVGVPLAGRADMT